MKEKTNSRTWVFMPKGDAVRDGLSSAEAIMPTSGLNIYWVIGFIVLLFFRWPSKNMTRLTNYTALKRGNFMHQMLCGNCFVHVLLSYTQ